MFQTPGKTSVWKAEPQPDSYSIIFSPELIKFIKDKRKYRTYRLGKKYDYLQVRDVITIKETNKSSVVSSAIVTGKTTTTFKELPHRSEIAHESYTDKEHQRQVFNGYYAYLGRPIADNDEFLVIDFELT